MNIPNLELVKNNKLLECEEFKISLGNKNLKELNEIYSKKNQLSYKSKKIFSKNKKVFCGIQH